MKITVSQLKGLIREAAEEAMEEMKKHEEDEGMMSMEEKAGEEEVSHEALQEAVAKAFRAGYRKGRAAKR